MPHLHAACKGGEDRTYLCRRRGGTRDEASIKAMLYGLVGELAQPSSARYQKPPKRAFQWKHRWLQEGWKRRRSGRRAACRRSVRDDPSPPIPRRSFRPVLTGGSYRIDVTAALAVEEGRSSFRWKNIRSKEVSPIANRKKNWHGVHGPSQLARSRQKTTSARCRRPESRQKPAWPACLRRSIRFYAAALLLLLGCSFCLFWIVAKAAERRSLEKKRRRGCLLLRARAIARDRTDGSDLDIVLCNNVTVLCYVDVHLVQPDNAVHRRSAVLLCTLEIWSMLYLVPFCNPRHTGSCHMLACILSASYGDDERHSALLPLQGGRWCVTNTFLPSFSAVWCAEGRQAGEGRGRGKSDACRTNLPMTGP